MYFLSALIPIATITSSNNEMPLFIISKCPLVIGSNDPGNIAHFNF